MNGLYSSQSSQFREFLLRANKYNSLKIAGDDGSTDKKLILVEVCNIKYNSGEHSDLEQVLFWWVVKTKILLSSLF